MGKYALKLVLFLFLLIFVLSCSKNEPITDIVTDSEESVDKKGRVSIHFIFNDNDGCGVRDELLIAKTHRDLYVTKTYSASPNVYYNKEIYEVDLEPGEYIYIATISCVCDGNQCARLGYGGGTKDYVDEFRVETGKTTYVTTFNMDSN
jgi:hypothetical protein